MEIVIDIETLPAPEAMLKEIEATLEMPPPRSGLKPETVIKKHKEWEAQKPEKAEEKWRKTSLSGAFGRILCIGYAIDKEGDYEEGVLGWNEMEAKFTLNEPKTLRDFWKLLSGFNIQRDRVIGHNIFDFDLKFIYQRSVVHNVKPTVELSFARYRDHPIFDTMHEWSKWSGGKGPKLEELAKILGLRSSKTEEISGDKVYSAFQEGRYKLIHDYCLADVALTRDISRRLTFKT